MSFGSVCPLGCLWLSQIVTCTLKASTAQNWHVCTEQKSLQICLLSAPSSQTLCWDALPLLSVGCACNCAPWMFLELNVGWLWRIVINRRSSLNEGWEEGKGRHHSHGLSGTWCCALLPSYGLVEGSRMQGKGESRGKLCWDPQRKQ